MRRLDRVTVDAVATLERRGAPRQSPHSGLRHVEVIARVLATKAAARLSPQHWASAEEQLTAQAELYTPAELHHWGVALVELLDQDGASPTTGLRRR